MRLGSGLVFVCCSIVTAVLLNPVTASAQSSSTIGIQGGVNIANVAFTDAAFASSDSDLVPDFKSRTRGIFGGFVAFDFNPNVGLQVDGLYTQKGTKYSFVEENGRSVKFEAGVDYLEFPILIRGNVRASNVVTFRAFGGPSFGFKVSDDAKITVNGEERDDDFTEFKSYDAGLVVGGAVQFGTSFVDFRYNWGLVKINSGEHDADELKTRTFSVMVGFAIK
jgi:hypothetical protein